MGADQTLSKKGHFFMMINTPVILITINMQRYNLTIEEVATAI